MSKNFNFSLIFLFFVFAPLSYSETNHKSISSNNLDPITIAGVFYIQPQYTSIFSKLNPIFKYPAFDTSLGWRPVKIINTFQNAVKFLCEMKK